MRVRMLLAGGLLFTSSYASLSPWATMAQGDLWSMKNHIEESSAAVLDTEHREFALWTEEGYAAATAMLTDVDSFEGYEAALSFYAAGFRDEHVQLQCALFPKELYWPGFFLIYDQGHFFSFAEGAIGEEVVAIDGLPVAQLLEERVFAFHRGVPSMESYLLYNTPYLLLYENNPFLAPLHDYTFLQGEEECTEELVWEPIVREDALTYMEAARQRPHLSFGIRDFLDGKGAWISLPTFYADNAATDKELKRVVEGLEWLRDRKVIVFDVRGNGGGSSFWGRELISALYGRPFAECMLYEAYKDEAVDYRVSEGNLAHFKEVILPLLEGSEDYFEALSIVYKMEEALREGAPSLVRLEGSDVFSGADEAPFSQFSGTVVFVTDRSCGSATLTFAMELLAMPNVVHVGGATSGNSYYLEGRNVDLPSGLAQFTFPVNIESGRKRGFNEVYEPRYRYPGSLSDTTALEEWVVSLLGSGE